MTDIPLEERPPQHQDRQPGLESEMDPPPRSDDPARKGSGKLDGRVALITGGDSGIGRAVAILFAREGADVAIAYYDEHGDAEETRRLVEREGRRCVTLAGDVGRSAFCEEAVRKTIEAFGKLDILVNNAAEQHPVEKFEQISDEQLERTFRTNIFGYFYMARAAMPHLKEGAAIINTTSVTAYRGNPQLIDYSSTKGAIVAFTRALAKHLMERKIRVNGVAPGPVWTPLIPASFPKEHIEQFGEGTIMGRPAEPDEIAPSYVFLASGDAVAMSGQVLHPNGGDIVAG